MGVQGDKRTYRHCLALFYRKEGEIPDWSLLLERARQITNHFKDFNRVVLGLGSAKNMKEAQGSLSLSLSLEERELQAPLFEAQTPAKLNPKRIALLQDAEAIVDTFLREKKIYNEIWQFPVVLLPIAPQQKEGSALVLRPVRSRDAMTASVYTMQPTFLLELEQRLKALKEIHTVFYDLTNKPPGTIEWE